jgi:menaquinol-cytochrome c reductase iron-sulfur subunit
MALPERMRRRRFLVLGTQVVGGLVGLALGIPIIGYLLSPIFERRQYVERRVGNIGSIGPGDPPQRFVVSFPQPGWQVPEVQETVYVVNLGSSYRVFSNTCTHMQCPVHWDATINQFLCPCHGGLYARDGSNVGGPPPKPLPEFVHRVDQSGVLYVQNRFTEEI